MKFSIAFVGRVKGAIGAFFPYQRTVVASSKQAAVEQLYDTHQDIRVVSCTELESAGDAFIRDHISVIRVGGSSAEVIDSAALTRQLLDMHPQDPRD